MSLKNATFLALITTILLAVVCLFAFVQDLMGVIHDVVPAVSLLSALIHLLATVGLAVFLYAFYRAR